MIDLPTGISICIALVSMTVAVMSFARNGKKDTQSDAIERANIKADLQYIRSNIDEIKLIMRNHTNEIADLGRRLTVVEESTKSAHKRIDQHHGGGN